MKKIILSALILFTFSFSTVAQFTVSKTDGTAVINGQILTFNYVADQIHYNQASLALKITNTASGTINLRMMCQNMTNTTGLGMEVCFGPDCYSDTSINQVFPPINHDPVNIPSGGVDTQSHFVNTNLGISTSAPVDYVFKIYQVDTFGTQIGTPFIFTYRYDATLSNNTVEGLNTKSVTVKSTTVDNNLDLEVNAKSDFTIYDLNGKLVLANKLDYGIQSVDVSNLSSGLYLINFVNEKGESSSKKFIKK